ncbi:MAG: hypothetical protein QXU32_07135 [Nitrososphaerales archaeon]
MEQPKTEVKTTSSVESILNSLSHLEKDLDTIAASIEDVKKRFNAYADEEIEQLKTKVIDMANDEAKRIIDEAKREADDEASKIIDEGEKTLGLIRKKIEVSFDRAVDTIVEKILAA